MGKICGVEVEVEVYKVEVEVEVEVYNVEVTPYGTSMSKSLKATLLRFRL